MSDPLEGQGASDSVRAYPIRQPKRPREDVYRGEEDRGEAIGSRREEEQRGVIGQSEEQQIGEEGQTGTIGQKGDDYLADVPIYRPGDVRTDNEKIVAPPPPVDSLSKVREHYQNLENLISWISICYILNGFLVIPILLSLTRGNQMLYWLFRMRIFEGSFPISLWPVVFVIFLIFAALPLILLEASYHIRHRESIRGFLETWSRLIAGFGNIASREPISRYRYGVHAGYLSMVWYGILVMNSIIGLTGEEEFHPVLLVVWGGFLLQVAATGLLMRHKDEFLESVSNQPYLGERDRSRL